MVFTQLREFQKNKKVIEIKSAVTPGLNDVLSKHEVTHGINSLKTKFKVSLHYFMNLQAIFDDWRQCKVYFTTRPIDPDFVSYSAQDVIDLSELADLLNAKIDTVLDKHISPNYRDFLVKHLSLAYSNKACLK